MKYSKKRQLVVLLMTMLLLFQTPAAALAEGEPPAAEETVPTPETAEPTAPSTEETQPETTEPTAPPTEETRPETTEPTTLPTEETLPEATQAEETQPEEARPQEGAPEAPVPQKNKPEESQSEAAQNAAAAGPGLYFGQLHGHTDQWSATPEEVFRRAAEMGLDFYALTDHSHGFDQETWAAGKAAAAAAATGRFVGIYGYEISWPRQMRLGHISAFGASGYQSWKQPEYGDSETALPHFYRALSAEPDAVSQFNHPGSQYGTFFDFDYSEEGDRMVSLMELRSGGADAWDFYIQALDKGWHLAPTDNQEGRTVVYARSLTEEHLIEGLSSRSVYATEDHDLKVLYTLDGHMMGSRLSERDLGQTMKLSVQLSDETDCEIGLVEVISAGGHCLASRTLEASSGSLDFSLKTAPGYYLIRVIQPDGHRAVTAPVWVDAAPGGLDMALTCETRVPEQKEETLLTLEFDNREVSDFLVESLEIFADDTFVSACGLDRIPAGDALSLPLSLCIDSVGCTSLKAVLTGTLAGEPGQAEASLELHFRQSRLARDILVDASHGSRGLDRLSRFEKLAASAHVRLTVCRDAVSGEGLKDVGLFLITSPEESFSPDFLSLVSDYVRYGGSLLVSGQEKTDPAELNRLLNAVGSTMRLEARNSNEELYAEEFNRETAWCNSISESQQFRASSGMAIHPGDGTWLVRGESGVLLAWEQLPEGGSILVSGSLFLTDERMAPPKDIWEEPLANRSIAEVLLGLAGEHLPLTDIDQARRDEGGSLLRIRGYVTAGDNGENVLCLQDDTGGIWAGPVSEMLCPGTAVELTGTVTDHHGNRFLKISSCRTLDLPPFLWEPKEGAWKPLLDVQNREGTLIQIEGKCLEVYCLENGCLTGCLLEDGKKNKIRLLVEEDSPDNDLHLTVRKDRTIRAVGILHVDEYGETVLRVRNHEEVVYVPPRNLPPYNPPTGDSISIRPLCLSALGLYLLCRRKKTSG